MPAPLKLTLLDPTCDVYGCGAPAALSTDGTETDEHVQHVQVPVFISDGSVSTTSSGKPGEAQGVAYATKSLGRPSLAKLNVCERHRNWPHSDDAKEFANDKYPDPKVPVPAHLAYSKRGAAK